MSILHNMHINDESTYTRLVNDTLKMKIMMTSSFHRVSHLKFADPRTTPRFPESVV